MLGPFKIYVLLVSESLGFRRASLIAQLVKNLPAMQETLVRLLGGEDPLEQGIGYPLQYSWASLVAQMVKNPPAVRETWVQKIPWTRERLLMPVFWPEEFHGLYSPWGHKESDTTERLKKKKSIGTKDSHCCPE